MIRKDKKRTMINKKAKVRKEEREKRKKKIKLNEEEEEGDQNQIKKKVLLLGDSKNAESWILLWRMREPSSAKKRGMMCHYFSHALKTLLYLKQIPGKLQLALLFLQYLEADRRLLSRKEENSTFIHQGEHSPFPNEL